MRARAGPREACVHFFDPAAPGGIEGSTREFLKSCHESASARYRKGRTEAQVHTVEYVVPTKHGDLGSTGSIIAHVGDALFSAWLARLEGPSAQRRAHIESQLRLALEDLGTQDMHGYLALTPGQRECYVADLEQLLSESLDRTTCSKVQTKPTPHWEGTLVKSVRPPMLVLVVSFG